MKIFLRFLINILVFGVLINCDNVLRKCFVFARYSNSVKIIIHFIYFNIFLAKNSLEEQILGVFDKWRQGAVNTKLFPLPSLNSININGLQSHYDGRGIK